MWDMGATAGRPIFICRRCPGPRAELLSNADETGYDLAEYREHGLSNMISCECCDRYYGEANLVHGGAWARALKADQWNFLHPRIADVETLSVVGACERFGESAWCRKGDFPETAEVDGWPVCAGEL